MDYSLKQEYDLPCGHKGSIVWISQSKKTIGVRCPLTHYTDFIGNRNPAGGSSDCVGKKGIVYLIDVSDEQPNTQ
jgi:hypothetical protein